MEKNRILGYAGAFLDGATGGYPLGNGYRAYLPGWMRFGAPDDASPFGPGGVNPYVYCAGDPINRADPTGHFFEAEQAWQFLRGMDPSAPLGELSEHDLNVHLNDMEGERDLAPQGAAQAPQGGPHATPPAPASPVRQGLADRAPPVRRAPRPTLDIDEIPKDHAGRTELLTRAYHLGQIQVAPYDDEESTLILEWWARISVKGKPLGRMDPRFDDIMKPLGFSRNRFGDDADMPWSLSLEKSYPRSVMINIALGGPVPGANGFRLLELPRSYSTYRYPKRMYTRAFDSALEVQLEKFLQPWAQP